METKKWYLSKGVDGSLASITGTVALIVVVVLRMFGVDAAGEQESIALLASAAIGLVGGIIALIGRLKAKTRIE
jgi:uncharacterized membrane protein YjjB (DUF3815 family)